VAKHREDWKLIDQALLRNFGALLDYIPNYEFCLSSSWRMNELCRKELFQDFESQKSLLDPVADAEDIAAIDELITGLRSVQDGSYIPPEDP
jgi:hypothetical protein